MRINFATCRCGARIFERSITEGKWEWAHAEPYAAHNLALCPDDMTALPLAGTQTNPRGGLRDGLQMASGYSDP